MKRAALLIGVSKTEFPQLQELQAVESSIADMLAWTENQQFDRVVVRTDKDGPVSVTQLQEDVDQLIKEQLDQLVIYFSGHGTNIGAAEYWLLSKAPRYPQEAVNVRGSADLARRSRVPHVVFISDACRTAASGIQAQDVTGAAIFPNERIAGQFKFVDQFFATVVGDPALEVPTEGGRYEAIYTKVLVEGLSCKVEECTDTEEMEGRHFLRVRPWPLRRYIEKELPKRLRASAVSLSVSQVPDALITSCPDTSWLAREELTEQDGCGVAEMEADLAVGPHSDAISPWHFRSEFARSQPRRFRHPAGGNEILVSMPMTDLDVSVGDSLKAEAELLVGPTEPTEFNKGCEFQVTGDTEMVSIFHPRASTQQASKKIARVETDVPISVVLQFGNGAGMILPAIPGFVVAVMVEGDAVSNVIYEPIPGTLPWSQYQGRLDEIRMLRAKVAAASRRGIFEPGAHGVDELAEKMKLQKGLDPTMAISAAYAFDRLQKVDRVIDMETYLFEGLNLRLFDVALMGDTVHEAPDFGGWGPQGHFADTPLLPNTPLLAQGWALLDSRNVKLPPSLSELRSFLTRSLWSTFTSPGVELLKTALEKGDIPK